jgi:hypothetical protein
MSRPMLVNRAVTSQGYVDSDDAACKDFIGRGGG